MMESRQVAATAVVGNSQGVGKVLAGIVKYWECILEIVLTMLEVISLCA